MDQLICTFISTEHHFDNNYKMSSIYRLIPAICFVLFFEQSPCICSLGAMFAPDLIVDQVCNDLTFLKSLANQSMDKVFEKYPTLKTDKDSCRNSKLDYTKYSICIDKKVIGCFHFLDNLKKILKIYSDLLKYKLEIINCMFLFNSGYIVMQQPMKRKINCQHF